MKKLLFASNNRGKYDELVKNFEKVGIKLVMPEHELILPESSEMLAENAYTKAKAAAEQTGMMALGDDSGVFIEALDYFPGVHSRRWFGDEKDDSVRNRKILELMKDEFDRTAFLISRFSIVDPNGNEVYKTSVKNEYSIACEEKGEFGFGYDKILIPTTDMWDYAISYNPDAEICYDELFEGDMTYCTIAEMTQEQKNAVTFRGRIAEEIANALREKTEGNN